MLNKYYQKHKERLRKESRERNQNLSEEEKDKKKKTKKGPRKFTEENKEKGVSIIRNVRRSYLTIEEIII